MVPWVGVAARLPSASQPPPSSSSGGDLAAEGEGDDEELMMLPVSTSLPRPVGSPKKGARAAGSPAGSAQALAVSSGVTGRAFCFLPLPTLTGLPVHVNGYFELSSNRRDIWWVALAGGLGIEPLLQLQTALPGLQLPVLGRYSASCCAGSTAPTAAFANP